MGERFGKFEIITRIATGGMAEIFLAKQVGIEGFQKLIVIKRILPHLSSDKEFVNMFLDEARMAAQLNHPNIVQIYDLGVIEGSYFIAMEYIDGVDISSILKKGREKKNFLRLGWILKIISQVCEGLYYAHTLKDSNGIPLGLIHRDITPENLLVSFAGSVKITDFGIARARGRSTSTTSGTLKGKFPYMSYEMVKGMEIDARSDIFSLGIVMWEMLTYRRLFKRDTEVASINAILNEEIPSPKKYFKNLPDGVEKIVMKALERDRDKRFQTAREMGNAIEDFISQKRVTVRISDLSDYLTELFPDRGISGDKKLTSSKIDKIVEIKEHKSASNSLPVITIQKKNPVGENGTVVLPPPTLEIKPEPEGGIDGNQEIEKKGEEISSDSNVKPLPKAIEEMEIGGHYVQEDKISNRHNEGTKSESLEVAREVIATTPSNKQSGKRNLLIAAVLMSLVLLVGVIFFVLNLGKRDEAVLNTTPKLLKEEGEKKASGIGEKEVVEERKEMGDAERSEVEKEKMEQSIEEKNRKAETVRKKEQKVASVERPKIQENVKKVEKMEEEGTEQEVKTSAIEPKKGFLSIDSDPWTEVYLDGKKIGDTPLVKYELIAGSYNLILKNSEFGFEKPLRININPEENSVSKVRFKKGFLNIETNRPAEVRIGGNLIGRTPLSNLDLYEGIYKITLFDPEQKRSKTIKVEIKEGKITSINENL